MQIITRNTNSTLTFTLKEKQTLTSPYFLFEFKCKSDSGTTKLFTAADLSDYEDRYNQFLVTEVNAGSEVLTSGTVNLQIIGDWDYRIFEQTSSTNLIIANTTSEVERGIIRVVSSASQTTYEHQITETSYTHNPS